MKIFKEFKQFVFRGNVIDLAVGIVIGSAFGTVVSAFVKDLVTPLIGAIAKQQNFSNLFFVINKSRFMYGDFINTVLSFLIIAVVIFFFVVKPMNYITSRFRKDSSLDPTTKKCSECMSEIPVDAKRCAHCTQVVR